MTFNRHIARFALNYSEKDIDAETRDIAKKFIINAVGCILAGANEEPSLILGEYAKEVGGREVCTVMGRKGFKTSPYNANLINGNSAYHHEYDDFSATYHGHPSVVILPGVLSACEVTGASGEEAFMAYAAGLQVQKLIGAALNKDGRYYSLGWHPTVTLGIFGAAAAIGRVFKLTEDQLVNALGIAASESAGLKGNFGFMARILHIGKCSADAYLAVQLAKKGYLSNPAIMECYEGYAYNTVKTIDYDDFLTELNKNESIFKNPGLSMNTWPSSKHSHSAINAIQNLRKEYGFKAGDVEKAECFLQPIAFECLTILSPVTKEEGKGSLPYIAALAIANGDVTLCDYEGELIEDQNIIALMKKVAVIRDDSITQGKFSNGKFDSKVKLYLKDGRVLEDWVESAKGEPGNPLSLDEVLLRFDMLASRALAPDKMAHPRGLLCDFDKLDTISTLMDAITNAVK